MELQRAQQQQQPAAGQVRQELVEAQRAPEVSLDPVDDVSWAAVVKCGLSGGGCSERCIVIVLFSALQVALIFARGLHESYQPL